MVPERTGVPRATGTPSLADVPPPALLDAIPYAVVATDADGRIVWWNAAAEGLYGIPAEQALGRNVVNVLVGPDARDVAAEIMVSVVAGETWSGEFLVRCAGGVVRRLRVTDTPVVQDGVVVGVVGVAEDVTSQVDTRAAADALAARLAKLARVTAELAFARDRQAVVDAVVTHAARAVGASVATLSLLSDGDTLVLAGISGGNPETPTRWASYPLSAPVPAADALRSGLPVLLVGRPAMVERYPALADQIPDERSLICLPLQVAERPIGVIGLVFPGRRILDEQELEFLTALADTCAQALDRVDALTEARTAAERLSFLAGASAELASSLDYRATLSRVARLAVPTLADWCAVDILEDGRLHTLAIAHVDPAKVALARDLQRRYPPDPNASTGAAHVARTGVSEIYPVITEEMVRAGARDEEHLRIVQDLRLRSAVVVPLNARGRTLGTITMVHAESGRRYVPQDLAVAEELARRAAVAIDNAHLHSQTRDVAVLLQRAVLPQRVPQLAGWSVAALYRPSGRTAVGGDFYDTVQLPDGRAAVVVGDVMGRGVGASAAMAHLRSAVRAYVALDPDPATVLSRLDQMFGVFDLPQFVTVLYALADPATGHVLVGNAGHLPPLVVHADGGVTAPAVPAGLPLGAGPDERQHVVLRLDPRQVLLAYTDGLVERRHEDIDTSIARLVGNAPRLAVADLPGGLQDLADTIHSEERDDDVTAVALRWDGPPA